MYVAFDRPSGQWGDGLDGKRGAVGSSRRRVSKASFFFLQAPHLLFEAVALRSRKRLHLRAAGALPPAANQPLHLTPHQA